MTPSDRSSPSSAGASGQQPGDTPPDRTTAQPGDQWLSALAVGEVGVFHVDIARDTMVGTREFYRIFGLPEGAELPASAADDAVIPADTEMRSNAQTRRDASAPLEVEYRIRRGDDGALRWISRKARFEFDAEGAPVRMTGIVQDITDRKEAQIALEESVDQFRTFAQSLPNHVWTAPSSGLLDWFNDRVYEYSGARAGELDGEGWAQLVHADDLPRVAGEWAAALASGELYETEFRIRRVDGAFRWHLVRALPIRATDGSVRRWVGTNTDIHERKLAEDENSRARDRIWALSQELMLVCDMDGRIVAVNPAAQRLLGWREDEMVGTNLLVLLHPDDVAPTLAELDALSRGATTLAFENRYRARSGEYRVLNWTAVPDGGLVHAVARDITQERAASAERERIWNSTNDLMATASLEGVLRAVNPAWTRLLGYDSGVLVGHGLHAFVDAQTLPAWSGALERVRAAAGAAENFELQLLHADGSRSRVAWTAEPVGDILYLVGRNVTEQRIAEEALRQAQKMDAVGQLTGGIAHDFNNLLQGITGSLTLVQKRIALGRTADLDRFIGDAMASARRAAALTHRLLAFSRRQPLDPRPLDVNPLVHAMVDLLRRAIGERIELRLELAEGMWLTRCDANQLENAILNLAINARDAMPDGGVLTITTGNAAPRTAQQAVREGIPVGEWVCVSVGDTGTGMSADTVAKAFEPFFTTKPIGQGTGLGLSMIYGFVRQSDGHTRLLSTPGQGTTCRLYLPRYTGPLADAGEAPATAPAALAAGDSETVLVAEDEEVVRSTVVEVLRELGYHVLQAADGPSGLAQLQGGGRIDLLVTDIGLPGLNGRQIAEAGRLRRPGLKVLFMTGYAENATTPPGFLEPGMAMLTKPFDIDTFAAKIRDLLGAGR